MTTLDKIKSEIQNIAQKAEDRVGYGCRMFSVDEIEEILDKYAEQEPCDDVVSRQYLIDIATKDGAYDYVSAQEIANAPSVRPQEPKTGHWIYTEYHTWCCSECGGNPHKGTRFVPNKAGMKMRWKYCNLCGAKMVEQQESEYKG